MQAQTYLHCHSLAIDCHRDLVWHDDRLLANAAFLRYHSDDCRSLLPRSCGPEGNGPAGKTASKRHVTYRDAPNVSRRLGQGILVSGPDVQNTLYFRYNASYFHVSEAEAPASLSPRRSGPK
jgi:hypothetical protein